MTGLSLPAERNIPDTETKKYNKLQNSGDWVLTVRWERTNRQLKLSETIRISMCRLTFPMIPKIRGTDRIPSAFGSSPIRSSYLVSHGDYIACHNQSYVEQYDLLEGIRNKRYFSAELCMEP